MASAAGHIEAAVSTITISLRIPTAAARALHPTLAKRKKPDDQLQSAPLVQNIFSDFDSRNNSPAGWLIIFLYREWKQIGPLSQPNSKEPDSRRPFEFGQISKPDDMGFGFIALNRPYLQAPASLIRSRGGKESCRKGQVHDETET
jgi:hypothetical protein